MTRNIHAREISSLIETTSYLPAAKLLKLRNPSVPALATIMEKGLPYRHVETFRRNMGYSTRFTANILRVNLKTMLRRREKQCLEPEEAAKLLSVANVMGKALEYWGGNAVKTRKWLAKPLPGLYNKKPIDLIRGGSLLTREVENLIVRLYDGIAY